MASQNQIEANRRNAQHSTGPRSPEGKAVSRYNALGGGIYADREAVLPAESPEALCDLVAEYYQRFEPVTPEHRCLVDCLVSDEWLMRRFRRIEGELMTRPNRNLKPSERFCLADAYEQNSRALERLQRRINATRKSYLKTLETLNRLLSAEEQQRAALRAEVARARKPAPAVGNQPDPPPIGFVPTPAAQVPGAVPDSLYQPARRLIPGCESRDLTLRSSS
jgi:hypothetical protein